MSASLGVVRNVAREAEIRDGYQRAKAVTRHHAKSFFFASHLLFGARRRAAFALYAFCRAVDDLADLSPDADAARAELLALHQALLHRTSATPLAAQFALLHQVTGACPEAAAALVATVLTDLGIVRMADEAALLRYAYGVAGTVGLMMCPVLGTHEPRAMAHAIDLGVAMQLTNIARDVADDAAQGRLYLPATWLPPGLSPSDVLDASGPVFHAVRQVLALADRRYRSAELGYRYLPPRVRPAIRAAARLYEEIGLRVLRHGPGYRAAGRCVVPLPRKLVLLAGCLAAGLPHGPHDEVLHAALHGLPGAHA